MTTGEGVKEYNKVLALKSQLVNLIPRTGNKTNFHLHPTYMYNINTNLRGHKQLKSPLPNFMC